MRPWVIISTYNIDGRVLNDLCLADDIDLLGGSEKDLH